MTSCLPKLVGIGSVNLIRRFHRSCRQNRLLSGSYEGEGKTTVTILNTNSGFGLMIDGLSSAGFKLNNGMWILGPMIIFPRSIISWNIGSTNEINEDSLALFKVLEPTLDIFLMGLDQNYQRDTPFINTLKSFMKKLDIKIDILPVEHACTTFNFLNAENRYVAAALLPPKNQLPRGLQALRDIRTKHKLSKAESMQITPD